LQYLIPYKNKFNIIIYTQRCGFDSNKYRDWNVIYDDEIEDYFAFIKMINAKVLIMGKSQFSIGSAMLNQNTVVFAPEIQRLDRWISKDDFLSNLSKIL
jgi:hypothetical protein